MLPATGTISYNGYTFTGACRHKVTGRPVYDDAGRTVVYVVWHLRVSDFVLDANATDTAITSIRNQLTTPGQGLTYTGTGFGDLTVNSTLDPNKKADVVYGPKPMRIDFTPIGTPRAYRLDWECEVAIPECSSGSVLYRSKVLAFNYELDFHIGEDGLTSRVYSGYIEIPMTRLLGGRQVLDTADRYREAIVVAPMVGFTRTQDFHLSKDKRRLDFTITDREVPINGLPWGCVSATGNIGLSNATPKSTELWNARISASYTIPKNTTKALAWQHFFLLVEDRRAIIEAMGKTGFILGFSANEGLYLDDRTCSFEITIIFDSSLKDLFCASGMWRPVPGTDGTQWAQSMAGVLGPRGVSGLAHNPADDAIIDLCIGQKRSPGPTTTMRSNPPPKTERTMRTTSHPDDSWLDYQCWVEGEGDARTMVHKRLPADRSMKNIPVPIDGGLGGGTIRSMRQGDPDLGGLPDFAPATPNVPDPDSVPGGTSSGGASSGGGGLYNLPLPASADEAEAFLAELEASGQSIKANIIRLEWINMAKKAAQAKFGGSPANPTGASGGGGAPPGGGGLDGSDGGDPQPPEGGGPPPQIPSDFMNVSPGQPGGQGAQTNSDPTGSRLVIQQRAAPHYKIRLMGHALRAYYPIPIPTLTMVGKAIAVPRPGHKVRQVLAANWAGVPIFYAEWDIPYFLDRPPECDIPYAIDPFLKA